MKEIILDNSLIVVNDDFKILNQKFAFGIEKNDFEAITEINIIHRNYLGYLEMCWKNHYGIIISPTILWNMILNNLAYKINQDPETFCKYFTDSDKKQEIKVIQDGNLIDVKLLIAGLKGRIPSCMLKDSFPVFTTDTKKSDIADYTTFLDMVSPYYNYSMYLCGIPKIKVLGTNKDWNQLIYTLGKITAILPECQDYLINIANHVAAIADNTCNYAEFFSLDKCGSGSQVEVSGWITNFFIEQPKVGYLENFISCISKIDYYNYNDENNYRLYAGLFTSEIENGYLVPAFDNMYFLNKIK